MSAAEADRRVGGGRGGRGEALVRTQELPRQRLRLLCGERGRRRNVRWCGHVVVGDRAGAATVAWGRRGRVEDTGESTLLRETPTPRRRPGPLSSGSMASWESLMSMGSTWPSGAGRVAETVKGASMHAFASRNSLVISVRRPLAAGKGEEEHWDSAAIFGER